VKHAILVLATGLLTAFPISGAVEMRTFEEIQDCIAALTEADLSSWASLTAPGVGTNDGFAVWLSPNIEVAYFDYQSHSTDSEGRVTSVTYLVTGITRQISCGLNSICPTAPDVDLVVRWMAEVQENVDQGNIIGLPVPNVCDVT
jgi:hypothetical protein